MKVGHIDNAEWLRPIAERWKEEANGDFGIHIDVNHHLEDMQRLIDDEGSELFGLFKDEKVVGYLGILMFNNPLGAGRVANEHYWYVHPDHRGFGSTKLLHAAKIWAKENNCSHLILNASKLASDLHDTVCRMYERLGLDHFETSYICEV
jgi:GNAT superfamily N-acetyltransferase